MTRRCFSQKEELFQKLKELEILIDPTEINCYAKLVDLLQVLRQITESSEKWVKAYVDVSRGDPATMFQLQEVVMAIDSLLFKNTIVNSDQEILNPHV